MWIFLSKKIAIPNNVKLKSISWNTEEGWIACGGEQGLLKVLKLETTDESQCKGIAAPNTLTMNQSLEGHKGRTMVVAWNENFRKLTSSDDHGLIIVWLLHKGVWFEEMINNRHQSVVRDLKWTSDGEKICIVYEDGAVIVGSVDGNRLWGRELKTSLSHVEWSPDGKFILFGTLSGQVKIYESKNGIAISDVKIQCLDNTDQVNSLAGIDWYDGSEGYSDINAPALAICYENGRCQLMRTELDENPLLIDCEMKVAKIKWNASGTILSIAGSQDSSTTTGDKRGISVVQFYNPYGTHLKTLKVPGSGVAGIAWEGTGLRLALAVDSYVFFANVRPDYKWGYFNKNTLIYSFTKLDRPEHCVVFWNFKTDEKYVKYIKRLVAIRVAGENSILVTKTDHLQMQQQDKKYILIICNSIGSPIDSKYISLDPKYVTMTSTHVIVADDTNIYLWRYKNKSNSSSFSVESVLRKKEDDEFHFHIDDAGIKPFKGKFRESETSDSVCAVCATEKHLFVARESGTIVQYSFPSLVLYDKFVLKCRPQSLAANCDSSRISVIDINGVFTLYKLNVPNSIKKGTGEVEPMEIERKEVWDMIWADDNPELFAIMEKTKMYTFRNTQPEEPISSSAYLAGFDNLKIKAILLDEILMDPEHPNKENILSYESRSLRDTKKILSSVSLEDAFTFVKDNPHPRLFKLMAEAALQKLDFEIAYKSFVACADYQGVQFVKKLKEFKDRLKQQAEVAAYFKNFEEAERIYKSIDRRDLAVELRKEIGDFTGVLQLIKDGGGDDSIKKEIYNQIGESYFDRKLWNRALTYYLKSENFERLVEVYYKKEDFKSMEKLIPILSEGHPLLVSIGDKFASVGMSGPAVKAFLRAGDPKKAIDTCIELNQWDKAVELAEKNNVKDIEDVLLKYADNLLKNNLIVEAIELFQASNRNLEAAKLLMKLGQEEANIGLQPMKAKMLFVFAALEVESVKRRLLENDSNNATKTISNLMEISSGHDRALMDNAWRGAEACHILMLAQRQLGMEKYEEALNSAMRLTNYEDILPLKVIYSLLALAALYADDYRVCSNAFTKLESRVEEAKSLEEQKLMRDALNNLAIEIFTRFPPSNSSKLEPRNVCEKCNHEAYDYEAKCAGCYSPFYMCVATGRNIFKESYWTCSGCKHRALEQVMYKKMHCPLCHNPIDLP